MPRWVMRNKVRREQNQLAAVDDEGEEANLGDER